MTDCDNIFCCPLAVFQTVTSDTALLLPQEITFCNYNYIFYMICVPKPCEMYVFYEHIIFCVAFEKNEKKMVAVWKSRMCCFSIMFLNLMCEGRLSDLFVLQWLNSFPVQRLNSFPAQVRSAVLVDKKYCQMNLKVFYFLENCGTSVGNFCDYYVAFIWSNLIDFV